MEYAEDQPSAADYAQAAANDAKETAQASLRSALDLEKRIARLELVFGLDKLERIMPLDTVVLPRHRYEKPHSERQRIDDAKERDRKRRGY